jgi:hypothetical protein
MSSQLNIRLSDEMRRELVARAEEREWTMGQIARKAFRFWLDEQLLLDARGDGVRGKAKGRSRKAA